MSWANDLQRLAKKGGDNLGTLAKAVKIELFSSVVSDTRVDTGRLRGNWQIQDEAPAGQIIERNDVTGAAVVSDIEREATESGLTYFTNHLPYAEVYEEKDAMVGVNVTRVRSMVREQVRRLR